MEWLNKVVEEFTKLKNNKKNRRWELTNEAGPIHLGLKGENIQEELKSLRNEQRKKIAIMRNKKFDPLDMLKEEIFHLLLAKRRITTSLTPSNPNTKRYDPSKVCAYHSNSPRY